MTTLVLNNIENSSKPLLHCFCNYRVLEAPHQLVSNNIIKSMLPQSYVNLKLINLSKLIYLWQALHY
jgi:hypothetical protein